MLVQSKSILAKLLAKENIRVEHKKVKTAYFDLASRTLVCPIWGDMSPELYDLLLGHEVGHAKNTPKQGWHDAVVENKRPGFKTYLNVVEDARIERKIKEEYPGLRGPFSKAYLELARKEFFGPSHIIESEDLPLIDRINLHFKIGAFANVKFNITEQKFVDAVAKTDTWDNVWQVAEELYSYGKQENKSMREKLEELMQDLELDYQNTSNEQEEDPLGEDSDDFDSSGFSQDEIEELQDILNKSGDNDGGGEPDDESPRSITDTFFRQKEDNLLDEKARPYLYADVPTANLNACIYPYRKVKDSFNFEARSRRYLDDGTQHISASLAMVFRDQTYKSFMDSNKKYISYLIKEFELRRNARQFARAKVAKSGEVDVKKVFSYQFNDDIFKRITTIPGGKSHGMVMITDFSGSMSNSIKGTIEQTLLLAIFCRKLSIPFRVFSFTDRSTPDELEQDRGKLDKFSKNKGELSCESNVSLVEYLSDQMSNREFIEASKNFLFLGEVLGSGKYSEYSRDDDTDYRVKYDGLHALGGTPLNEALIVAAEFLPKFKDMYKLDIINAIILTDGQGHELYAKYTGEIRKSEYYDYDRHLTEGIGDYNVSSCNVILSHKKSGIQGKKLSQQPITCALLDLLGNICNTNVVGFYLMDKPTSKYVNSYMVDYGKYLAYEEVDDMVKSIRRNKFAAADVPGYKKFFILPNGKDLELEEEEIKVQQNASKNDLKKAFIKFQKNKLTNRVFLSKFIEQIA